VASVELARVGKTYPSGLAAVRGVTLAIADGEFLVLVGPSGCGKSTVLRMIAGLEPPTAGRVLIGGRDVTGLPPQDRDVAMVFQSYALYPHMTVRRNLAFGLRMRGVPRALIAERVAEAARLLDLTELLERRPAQLSGGQRQRVALGRAIVREPKVFLMDEPLSNLDAKLRMETRAELARLHRRLATTVVYVTHDQEEAMTLGGRVAVMRAGRIEQVAAPMELYRAPANVFVAGFVGSPQMNLLPARGDPGGAASVEGGAVLPLPPTAGGRTRLLLGIRPHDLALTVPGAGDCDARVDVVEPRGSELLVYLRLGDAGTELRVTAPPSLVVQPGAVVGVVCDRSRLHWFDAESEQRLC